MGDKIQIVKRLQQLAKQENLWVQYASLAAKHKALNLGQGFPDFPPPKHVTEALAAAVTGPNYMLNQYTRAHGHPRLVQALSRLYSPKLHRNIDPLTNILVSNGAYVSLYSAIHSMVEEGDEVVILEPFFDCYDPMVRAAGGKSVFVPLRPPKQQQQQQLVRSANDWCWDEEELRSAFNPKTKMLLINTPNNPTGKIFSQSELSCLAQLCQQHNVICVSDEVYEHIVYPGNQLVRMANLPGMWERTVTIGSAGKTFSVTGWKLGWAIAPKHLIDFMKVVHDNSCYTCHTLCQEAVAVAMETDLNRLDSDDCYFKAISAELLPKRDRIAELANQVNLPVYLPAGGYFMLIDISNLPDAPTIDESVGDRCRDAKLVKWLTVEQQLATIPCTGFYSRQNCCIGENFIRICFIKQDATIEAFGDKLKRWLG